MVFEKRYILFRIFSTRLTVPDFQSVLKMLLIAGKLSNVRDL